MLRVLIKSVMRIINFSRVANFANGSLVHTQTFDGYQDTTTVRRVITDGPREVNFEFTDTGVRHGDYYFVRVVQANDAIAWSSPVWIGGHSTR